MKETMKQTNTTSSIISLRSYFGVGLIMTGVLAGGCLSGEELEPSEEVGSVESAFGDGAGGDGNTYSYEDEDEDEDTGGAGGGYATAATGSTGTGDMTGSSSATSGGAGAADGGEDPDGEDPGEDGMCEEPPDECDVEGDQQEFCGEQYECGADPAVAEKDPTWRECVDGCVADGLKAKQDCDTDLAKDLWVCKNDRPYWMTRFWCDYFAGQTRNLCYVAAGSGVVACEVGCGAVPIVNKIWKKIK